METSHRQTSLFGKERSISSQEDSPVNHTPLQEKEKVQKMIVTSGQKCLEQFEKFNQATLWAKTFMDLLIGTGDWYSKKSKLTWKLKASKYSQLYFQLAASMLPIEEIESGLWPTPTSVQLDHPERVAKLKATGAKTMMSRKAGENRPNSILDAAMFNGLIPTPTTIGSKGASSIEALKKRGRYKPIADNLADQFAQHGKSSQLNPQFVMEMMGFPSGKPF